MKKMVAALLLLTVAVAGRPFDISPQQFVDRLQRYFKKCGVSQSIKLLRSENGKYILRLDDYAKFTIVYKDPQKINGVYLNYSGKIGSFIPTGRIANQSIPFLGALTGKPCKQINKGLVKYMEIDDAINNTLKDDGVPMEELRMDGVLIMLTKDSDYGYEVDFIREAK